MILENSMLFGMKFKIIEERAATALRSAASATARRDRE